MAGNRMHNTYACMICLTIHRNWFSFHLCLQLIWSAGCIISHSRLLLLRIRIIFFLSSIMGSIIFKRVSFLILSILPTAWEIGTCLNVILFWRTQTAYERKHRRLQPYYCRYLLQTRQNVRQINKISLLKTKNGFHIPCSLTLLGIDYIKFFERHLIIKSERHNENKIIVCIPVTLFSCLLIMRNRLIIL